MAVLVESLNPYELNEMELEVEELTMAHELKTRESLKRNELSLRNIRLALVTAFQQIDLAELDDIVIAIGKTGSGKSTLLSSMILGSENLMIKINGDRRKVIDFKDGVKPLFSIGHSLN